MSVNTNVNNNCEIRNSGGVAIPLQYLATTQCPI